MITNRLQQNVPRLRFPGFEGEWKIKELNKVGEIIGGGTPDTTNPKYWNGDINWLTPTEVKNRYIYKSNRTITELGLKKSSAKLVPEGAVIFTSRATIGDVAINRIPLVTNQGFQSILVNNENNNHFVYYWAINNKKLFLRKSSGSTFPEISRTEMAKIKLSSPTKPEQQKIANFVTAVDDKISALDKKVIALKQYKKGLMQKIFSQQIRFRDENGDLYPDWKKLKLNEIFNEICQKVGDSNIETYSITAGKGFISQSKKFGKDISGNQNKNYILLNEGDFSYNKGNSKTYKYGCVYVNNENKQIAVPNVFISFRLKIPNMSISYFEQLFISHYLDKYLIQIISSGARMDGLLNVSKGSFFSIKVLTPSNEEQQKIANFLTTIDQKITAEESKLKIAKEWKKGLVQRMFV